MREYTTPAVIEVSASARLSDAVFDRADSDPGSVLLRRKAAAGAEGDGGPQAQWKDVPARQFRDEVAAVAKGLIAAGIGEGDRVALMSRTRYEWTVADYAIWTAGAVTVPIYETSSAEQVEWILSNSGARAAIVETSARLATFSDVLERLPDVTQVWLMDPDPAGPTEPLDALVAGGAGVSDTVLLRRRMSRGAADLATIIYTSGTTGRPKGCEITHKNLLAAARNAVHGPLAAIFETPGASTLLFLPLAHSFARIIEVGVIEAGAVLGHTPDMANLLPDLATFQPTFILAVPRVFEKVFNSRRPTVPSRAPSSRRRPRPRSPGARRSAAKTRQRPGGPGRACASSTPCSIASSTASSGRRSAAGWRSRYPVAPRSESGWAISSVALGSPSSRATASPRRPPPPR
jgi:long-chain acyl-CoA synthetase